MNPPCEVETQFGDFIIQVKAESVHIKSDFTSDDIGDFTDILRLYHALGGLLMRNNFL